MKIFDSKFVFNKGRYVLQCFMASFTMLVVLVFVDVIQYPAIVATLGASAFIVFAMPKSYSARTKSVLGGYCVGILIGLICFKVSSIQIFSFHIISKNFPIYICGAFAVGLSIFIMSIINTEHPPAAGMALGIVLNGCDTITIVFVVLAVIVMASVRKLFYHYLIDLA